MALIEAIVSLFVAALVGMALLQMVLLARKLQARRQVGVYVQSLINVGLSQTLDSSKAESAGQGLDGYHWIGTRTQKPGYRLARVTVKRGEQVVAVGEQVEAE